MNTQAPPSDRNDAWLPTAVALLLSLLLHVTVFSGVLTSLQIRQERLTHIREPQQVDGLEKEQEKQAKKQEEEDHELLGRDKADDILTLNWIGYDAYEKLIAMPADTQQAAFQRLADPIEMPDADAQIDPATDVLVHQKTTPQPQASAQQATEQQSLPTQQTQASVQPREPVDSPMEQAPPDTPQQSSPVVEPTAVAKVVPVPVITPQMDIPDRIAHEQPIMAEQPSLAMLPQTNVPHKPQPAPTPEAMMPQRVEPTPPVIEQQQQTQPTPPQQQQRESVAQPYNADQLADKPRPTNVPREDRESSPYSLDHHEITGKIGGVLVGKGIEIQTRIPRFTAVTQASIWPKANPIVEITFASDGVVITAKIIKSSGYAGIDSPILTSVYHWKAKGELMEKLGRPFKRQFTFKLFDDSID
jgi:hypothetical protein